MYDDGQEPKYRYYRFYGTSSSSCAIGEIVFKGVEVMENSDSTYASCPIQLNLYKETPIDITGTVTYSSEDTAVVTSINPRWG